MSDPDPYTRLDDHGASEQWGTDHHEPPCPHPQRHSNNTLGDPMSDKPDIFRDHGGPVKPGLNKVENTTGRPEFMIYSDKGTPEERIREAFKPAILLIENEVLKQKVKRLRRYLIIGLLAFTAYAAYNLAVSARAVGWI